MSDACIYFSYCVCVTVQTSHTKRNLYQESNKPCLFFFSEIQTWAESG